MIQEWSKEELLDAFNRLTVNGMINQEKMAELIFNPRFPQKLKENAESQLIRIRDSDLKYRELAAILVPKVKKIISLYAALTDQNTKLDFEAQVEIRNEIKLLEMEIKPLDEEFLAIRDEMIKIFGTYN